MNSRHVAFHLMLALCVTCTLSLADESCDTAQILTDIGSATSESLSVTDSRDYFEVTLPQVGTYSVQLQVGALSDFDVAIYEDCIAGTGQNLLGSSSNGVGEQESIIFQNVGSNNIVYIYVFQVSGAGSYELSPIEFVPPTPTPLPLNDTCNAPLRFTVGSTPETGAVSALDPRDIFEVQLPAATSYELTVRPDAGVELDVAVYERCISGVPDTLVTQFIASVDGSSQTRFDNSQPPVFICGVSQPPSVYIQVDQRRGDGGYSIALEELLATPTPLATDTITTTVGWSAFSPVLEPVSPLSSDALFREPSVLVVSRLDEGSWTTAVNGVPLRPLAIEPTVGYLAYASDTSSFIYGGEAVRNPEIELRTGWNFVGFPGAGGSVSAQNLLARLQSRGAQPAMIGVLQRGRWELATATTQTSDFAIQPGEAYLIYATADWTGTIDASR